MRKAFTLIELVVALAILAIMMMFASSIFRYSINAQRMAVANSEIMQKLRVITEQLDADFRGVMPQYGGGIRDQDDTFVVNSVSTTIRSDSIAFFANGDFRSTQQYKSGSTAATVVGNAAAIFYGTFDLNPYYKKNNSLPAPQERMLLRGQTILCGADSTLPDVNWGGEYYRTSLEKCRLTPPYKSLDQWLQRPEFDPTKADSFLKYWPMYLAKGVNNFTISYLQAGVGPKSGERIPWHRLAGRTVRFDDPNGPPRSVKFEFTLYDSRGIIKNGRTFSHIVMLGG
jgi:prepilin-type N-terminal cleavage/methylation domain-containing protein